jgi:hypothetical protein
MHTKGDPTSDSGKMAPSTPRARLQLRSKTVNNFTCVAGLATAGLGLLGVLAGARGAFDVLLLLGGLLVAIAGLILRGRSSRT